MRHRPLIAALILTLSGCTTGGSIGGIDVPVNGIQDDAAGAGNTVGTADPGSGPASGAYRIDALVEGSDTFVGPNRLYESKLEVDVEDAAGDPITGATLTMVTPAFGEVDLAEDLPGNPGRYKADAFGYDRTWELIVDGPDGEFRATAIGPGIHAIDVGPRPVETTQTWDITWLPMGAMFAEIDSRGDGKHDIEDLGAYTIAADTADWDDGGDTDEEKIDLTRWDILELTGAISGSEFRIEISIKEDDIDTVKNGLQE